MTVLRAAAVIAALLALPVTAHAGTLSRTGNALTYTATAGGESVQVGTDGVPFVESAGLLPPDDCYGTGRVFCPIATTITLTFVAGAENSLDGAAISHLMTITAVGGGTNDRLTGGPHRDTLSGGAGSDNLDGGGGNDVLVANNLGNELRGRDGNDSLKGGTGSDRLVGNEGDDTIDARDGRDDSIDCGPGNDVVYADAADFTENCEVAPDRDGDGFLNGADCAPDNAAINPGAGEIIGNAVDEDCKSGPLYARVVSPVSYSIKRQASRNRMRFTKVTVGEIKPGDKIEIRCSTKARGCPFTKKTVNGKSKRTVSVLSQFKSRWLRKGAVVEIRTTRANEIGSVRRLTVGSRGTVKSQLLCLNVGAATSTRCV